LVDDAWRTAPFGDLSVQDLQSLSVALEEDGEVCEQWGRCGLTRPAHNLWISPHARNGGN